MHRKVKGVISEGGVLNNTYSMGPSAVWGRFRVEEGTKCHCNQTAALRSNEVPLLIKHEQSPGRTGQTQKKGLDPSMNVWIWQFSKRSPQAWLRDKGCVFEPMSSLKSRAAWSQRATGGWPSHTTAILSPRENTIQLLLNEVLPFGERTNLAWYPDKNGCSSVDG